MKKVSLSLYHLPIPGARIREASWTLVAVGPVEAVAALWYLRNKMCVALWNPRQRASSSKEISTHFNLRCNHKQHQPPPTLRSRTCSLAGDGVARAQSPVHHRSPEGRPGLPAWPWPCDSKTDKGLCSWSPCSI